MIPPKPTPPPPIMRTDASGARPPRHPGSKGQRIRDLEALTDSQDRRIEEQDQRIAALEREVKALRSGVACGAEVRD